MRQTLVILLLLLTAIPCRGAGIRLTGAAPVYRLEATDLVRVAAVDLTLEYNPAAFVVEAFTPGPLLQGTMAANNISSPGKLRLGAVTVNGIHGSGLLGTVQVRSLAPNLSPAFVLNAKLNDLEGKPIPVSVEISSGSKPPVDPAATPVSTNPSPNIRNETQTTAGTTANQVERRRASTVVLSAGPPPAPNSPAANPLRIEPAEPPPDSKVEPRREPAARPTVLASEKSTATAPQKKEITSESPIERFAAALPQMVTFEDLIKVFSFPRIRQQPFPALSDGRTPVWLLIEERSEKPSIAVQNGKILSCETGSDGLWIELLPWPNAASTRIIVLGETVRDLELVVAPPIASKEERPSGVLLPNWRDLDGNGTITIEEAYILAVNLLADSQRQETKR